ncbi:MAG: hypothetical protein N3I86_03875 [Verrucomicrobiae bacterium]|nr:hypothetical protein [Verrucomicrobiae bacterium]
MIADRQFSSGTASGTTHRTAHSRIDILIRRKSHAAERAALLRLLDAAGQQGLSGNIDFA